MTPVSPRHGTEVRPRVGAELRLASKPPARIASFPPVIDENPYQRLLYGGLASYGYELERDNRFKVGWLLRARARRTILHFHWLQGYYTYAGSTRGMITATLSWARLFLFGGRLLVARALGFRIVWTVHQVYPHESESRTLDRVASFLMSRASSILLAHDSETAAMTRRELQLDRERVSIVGHGSYVGVYPTGRPRDAVREELGLETGTFVFLAFGHVRAYKDIELLVDAFRDTRASLPNAALVVAGVAMDDEAGSAIREAAHADDRIHQHLQFVPDERVAELFDAADVGVLARGDGGTSGALILALSLGLPVIAARAPLYVGVVGEEGAGRFFEPGDRASLAEAFEAFGSEGVSATFERRALASARAARLRWEDTCAVTAELLDEVCP